MAQNLQLKALYFMRMKKKVLPQFYKKYTPAETQLMEACKAHFSKLKADRLAIIPYAMVIDVKQQTQQLSPSVLKVNPALSFIEQFWEQGRCAVQFTTDTMFCGML